MPTIMIRPRVLHTRLALTGMAVGAVIAAAAISSPAARADGTLDPNEAKYVDRYHGAVCKTIDAYPTLPGVLGVMEGITDDGFANDSTVDIVNASVQFYCPEHWPLLVAIGRMARANNTNAYVA